MAGMKNLRAWWQSLPLPWRKWHVHHLVSSADEVPEHLPYGAVVLVGMPNELTWAAFDCPCRRGHRIMINLDKSRYPFWSVRSHKPLSIYPSIDDVTLEYRCHFTIRAGNVNWALFDNHQDRLK